MSEILLESLRWGGFVFFGGGSRKGGFGRTPRTPPGYGPEFTVYDTCSVDCSILPTFIWTC